mmetsp:Transcript_94148/g.265870  ORF Transcript_94148/g.265870 Transcript_94148/m.265870 type:complete len:168 (+) Transcript_94148:15-518(+)
MGSCQAERALHGRRHGLHPKSLREGQHCALAALLGTTQASAERSAGQGRVSGGSAAALGDREVRRGAAATAPACGPTTTNASATAASALGAIASQAFQRWASPQVGRQALKKRRWRRTQAALDSAVLESPQEKGRGSAAAIVCVAAAAFKEPAPSFRSQQISIAGGP